MKKTYKLVILLFMITMLTTSVFAETQNTINSTAVPIRNATIAESPTSTIIPSTLAIITVNTTLGPSPTNSTFLPISTTDQMSETLANTTLVTLVPATLIPPATLVTTGNITAVSSPLGANILIDGVFYGYTPKIITGVSSGNHIIRLTLSGYYDYDGTIYIIPGQDTNIYGTLPPLNGYPARPLLSQEPNISITDSLSSYNAVQTTSSPSAGPLENPTILAAIIGAISVFVGALVTIFTHIYKVKQE